MRCKPAGVVRNRSPRPHPGPRRSRGPRPHSAGYGCGVLVRVAGIGHPAALPLRDTAGSRCTALLGAPAGHAGSPSPLSCWTQSLPRGKGTVDRAPLHPPGGCGARHARALTRRPRWRRPGPRPSARWAATVCGSRDRAWAGLWPVTPPIAWPAWCRRLRWSLAWSPVPSAGAAAAGGWADWRCASAGPGMVARSQPATPITTTAASAMAARASRHARGYAPDRRERGAAGQAADPAEAAARRPSPAAGALIRPACSHLACAATSAALAGLRSGSLAVRPATSAATPAGTDGGSGGSGRSRCASATASGPPPNGRLPARHSYAIIPSAYRSAAGLAEAPAARSGAMYAGVPAIASAPVARADPAARMSTASPKSVILTWPSPVTIRFPGLISRCTSPAVCAASRPAAT